MAQYYRLPSPGVTSISVDGVEHKVDENGVVTVEMMTPNLDADLRSRGAVAVASAELGSQALEEHSSARSQAEDGRASRKHGHAATPGASQAATTAHSGNKEARV